jgi:hypothetical protein
MERATSEGSLFACGKGQIYILEAIMTTFIVLGAVFFMLKSTPSPGTHVKEFSTLQLKKYADDILEILSVESPQKLRNLVDIGNHTGLIYECVKAGKNGNWKEFDENFSKIGLALENLSILYKVEVFKFNDASKRFEMIHCNGTCIDAPDAVSSFKVVIIDGEVYEVRLTLWYV